MSSREKVVDILGRLLCVNFGKTDKINDLVDNLIAAVKEEITPKLRPYQQKEIDDLKESFKEPQLIQGYTPEQWQEIIDDGYLCEVSQFADFKYFHLSPIKELRKDTTHDFVVPRLIDNASCYSRCRPAQIKGVMRPIFVEPVDDQYCVFFDIDGRSLFGGNARWSLYKDSGFVHHEKATKYIEV